MHWLGSGDGHGGGSHFPVVSPRHIVFDKGRITASGTHAELYTANPLYRSLYDRQHAAT